MQQLSLFIIFFSYVHGAFSADSCLESNPCACTLQNKSRIDLSTVGSVGKPRFSLLFHENQLYSYNPCYSFSLDGNIFVTEKDQLLCRNVAACLLTPGQSDGKLPSQRALGVQSTAWSIDQNVTKIKYSLSTTEYFTVTLVCNRSLDVGHHHLNITSETSFVLTSKCACPDEEACRSAPSQSKSGLSTGSVLLITFFVIVLVYIGVGILFNFCRGAHGTELLPNSEFWNDLPKLIMDGFLFTCSCFGRRSAYADV